MSASRAVMVVCVALASSPTLARAWCRMQTDTTVTQPTDFSACAPIDPATSHPLFWAHRCSEIAISSAAPPRAISIAQVQDVFRIALATWDDADCGSGVTTGLHVDVLTDTSACTAVSHHDRGHNVSSIEFIQDVDDWSHTRMHDSMAFAVTLVWNQPSTGEIVDVDMEVNESRGAWMECADATCGGVASAVDLQNVITHELGHYFGLAHTTNDHMDATMWASAPFGEISKRDLTADDIDGICTIYAPGTLPAACDATPTGGLGLDCTAGACACTAPGARRGRDTIGLALVVAVLVLARARTRRSAARARRRCGS